MDFNFLDSVINDERSPDYKIRLITLRVCE